MAKRLDFHKNSQELLKAWKTVSEEKSNDWLIFGYEGKTAVLKVDTVGSGDLSELSEQFSASRCQYGYCRVTEPSTGLDKFVLIHWQGESVPEFLKGSFAAHIDDVKRFVKIAHATVHARNEDDIEVGEIMKQLAKAHGGVARGQGPRARPEVVPKPAPLQPAYKPVNAASDIAKLRKASVGESTTTERPEPVGSVYQKANPAAEIGRAREQFWKQQQSEEVDRKKAEAARRKQEVERLDKERREREQQEQQNRDRMTVERQRAIQSQREAEKEAENRANLQISSGGIHEALADAEERSKRSDNIRKGRQEELRELLKQKNEGETASARNFFETQATGRPAESAQQRPPPKKLQTNFVPPAAVQPEREPSPPRTIPQREPTPEPEPHPEPSLAAVTSPSAARTAAPAAVPFQEPPPAMSPPATSALPQSTVDKLLRMPSADSDEEEYENKEDWYDNEDSARAAMASSNEPATQAPTTTETFAAGEPLPDEEYDAVDDDEPAAAAQTNGDGAADNGLSAYAMYDYDAQEDNEITLQPGDLITDIDQIDPGWWVGTAPNGSRGMFPANYVQLQ